MTLKEEILSELNLIKNTKFDETNVLTNNVYFLNGDILLKQNKCGDARIPFTKDGLTLWVHQNGNISLNESNFFLISEALEGETNFLAFFLGIKKDTNKYLPISLFEINKNIFEENVKRYTIFKNSYAIFIMIYDGLIYGLRVGLSDEKDFIYEIEVINKSNFSKEIYSSMFFNFNLMHSNHNSVETKWFKKASYENNLFTLETVEDVSPSKHLYYTYYLCRKTSKDVIDENTTSRGVYSDGKTCRFDASPCLLEGKFSKKKNVTRFNDLAICGDILKAKLDKDESLNISYVLSKNIDQSLSTKVPQFFEKSLQNSALYYKNKNFLKMDFKESDKINGDLFTSFIEKVVYQVDYCARTKNSTLTMLGIRDIFQAIEAGLIWNPVEARKKIIEAINFTNINGRLPRQYSLPASGENFAYIDAREFIDSGLWVIDTIYQYLSYTNDSSILSEMCSYIEIKGNIGHIKEKKDTLLNHLYLIMNYLLTNIAEDTHCLRILYGDWNDAVDGLGKKDGFDGFTNGVSVMATFQLYSALTKMIDIVGYYDKDNYEIKEYYEKKRLEVYNGLKANAFVSKNNDYKVVHGWADKKEFYVGSFNDVDEKSRDSLTSNAFYVISDYFRKDDKYVKNVLNAYKRLDSKYGLLTFNPGFEKDAFKVGRIVNLPIGTAENGAVYIHGACFAIDSLFTLGEDEFGWNEIFKIIPITHPYISTTPFIMPNSYGFNKSIEVDGESMNDWFTGSSSTLVKLMIRNIFGIKVTLDNLIIQPAHYFPFKEAQIHLTILGKSVSLKHISKGNGKRIMKLNGKGVSNFDTDNYKKEYFILPISEFMSFDSLEIEVID